MPKWVRYDTKAQQEARRGMSSPGLDGAACMWGVYAAGGAAPGLKANDAWSERRMAGSNLFTGTLDLLILQALRWGPLHGYAFPP